MKLPKFTKNEKGATAPECALLLALMCMGSLTAVSGLQPRVGEVYYASASRVEEVYYNNARKVAGGGSTEGSPDKDNGNKPGNGKK